MPARGAATSAARAPTAGRSPCRSPPTPSAAPCTSRRTGRKCARRRNFPAVRRRALSTPGCRGWHRTCSGLYGRTSEACRDPGARGRRGGDRRRAGGGLHGSALSHDHDPPRAPPRPRPRAAPTPPTTGPGLGMAVLTTLSGAFCASAVILPLSAKLHAHLARRNLRSQMLIDGILLVHRREYPTRIERVLRAHVGV